MVAIPETIGEGKYSYAGLNFDWTAEVQAAYRKLVPYYTKVLEMAGGDLDLAKRIIESNYSQGMRENKQEYEQAAREQALTFPQEQEQQIATLGRRGVLGGVSEKQLAEGTAGGLAGQEAQRLLESQKIRKEAIERALENRTERLTSEKGFGTEQAQTGFEKTKLTTARQQEQEAAGMASSKFSRQLGIAQAIEQKRQAEETARLAKEQFEWTKNQYTGGGGGGGGGVPSGYSTLQQYYAETGQMAEFDRLKREGLI